MHSGLGISRLQRRFDRRGDEFRYIPAQTRNLFHQFGRNRLPPRIRHHEHRLDRGIKCAVHANHLKLFDETLLVCAAANLRGASLADLARRPLLQLETRPTAWRDWFSCQGYAGDLPQGMLFDQFAPMIEAAVHGLGLALVPDFMVQKELAEGRLTPWAAAVPGAGAYYLVWPKARDAYAPLQALRAWLARC